jgi:hypothetical protein
MIALNNFFRKRNGRGKDYNRVRRLAMLNCELRWFVFLGDRIMCNKIYGSIVVLASIVLAVLVLNVSVDNLDNILKVMKFFDVMIPILAVGALVKYIFCGGKKCKCGTCSKCGTAKEEKAGS